MPDTEKKVVVIPAKPASEIRQTKRLNVAAYCRVSTDEEEQERPSRASTAPNLLSPSCLSAASAVRIIDG